MEYPIALGAFRGSHMKIYSIVRIGDEFVVRAGDKSVLKTASRRRAVQMVTDAAELLESQGSPQLPGQSPTAPSPPMIPGLAPDPQGRT
jgi:hypothetical protein